MGTRRRLGLLVPLGVAAAVYFVLAPRWPADQAVRFVLGDAAPRVRELDVRYAEASHETSELTREVSFRYAPGSAPRIVSHEPRLANGDYLVEMELTLASTDPDASGKGPPVHVTLSRRVALQGGTTLIDVSRALARGGEER